MSRRSEGASIHGRQTSWNTTTALKQCQNNGAKLISAPHPNVWEGLTDSEAASVVSWLFNQTELNLTTTDDATAWDNTM